MTHAIILEFMWIILVATSNIEISLNWGHIQGQHIGQWATGADIICHDGK